MTQQMVDRKIKGQKNDGWREAWFSLLALVKFRWFRPKAGLGFSEFNPWLTILLVPPQTESRRITQRGRPGAETLVQPIDDHRADVQRRGGGRRGRVADVDDALGFLEQKVVDQHAVG